MTDYKRDWPKKSHRVVRGFFFGAAALNCSLEATGLAAHVYASAEDVIDEEYLKSMFPGRDLSGPLRELTQIGLIEITDENAPLGPIVENDGPAVAGRAGTIYLIEGAPGRFKVGITKSTRARMKSLQTGSPVPLRLVHSAFVRDSAGAERLAHGLLTRFKLHGEWFECLEERAVSVLNTVIEAIGEK
jgi:hypothetical protein